MKEVNTASQNEASRFGSAHKRAYFRQFRSEVKLRCVECRRTAPQLWGTKGYLHLESGAILCLPCLKKFAREAFCLHKDEWQRAQAKRVIHHLDGDHSNNDPSNLAELCPSCHNRLHAVQRRRRAQ